MEQSGATFRWRAVGVAVFLAVVLLASGNIAARADSSPATFDQVLNAPDDPEINLAFARQQADDGHLLNAAAALERILLAHPNAHGVRLFYAVVLYRLNDLQGAKRQLKLLDGVRLTPLQTAERDKYERLVEGGQSRNAFHGKVFAGVVVESDAVGALLERMDQFPFFNRHPKNGAAVVAGGDVAFENYAPSGDLGVFASASIYTRTAIAGPPATLNFGQTGGVDFQTGEFRAGITGSSLDYSWKIGPLVNHTLIFDQPYLTEYGGQTQFDWRYSTSATFSAGAALVQQNYHEPQIDALVPFTIPGNHDGPRYTVDVGGRYRLDSYSTVSATIGYEGKEAGYDAFSYDSAYLDANYHALLGRGTYFDLQGDVRYVIYRAKDPVFLFRFIPPFGAVRREDVRSDVRAAVGAPLSAFSDAGATGDYRENLIVEGAVSFVDRTSRFPLEPFHSLGGEVRLIYKFGEAR